MKRLNRLNEFGERLSDFMFNLISLQTEQKEWQERNFGPQSAERMLLGICEEVGELCEGAWVNNLCGLITCNSTKLICVQMYLGWLMHAELKRQQGIRGLVEEKTDKELYGLKAVLFFLNDLFPEAEIKWKNNYKLVELDPNISVADSIGDLAVYMAGFCNTEGVDISLQTAVEDTWREVSKRDWKRFPKNGVSE